MKKMSFVVVAVLLSFVAFSATPTVNEVVLQAFKETFSNVQEVAWHEYPDHYEVRFKQGTIDSRVTYDTEGNVLGSRRYYFEDQLPLGIRCKIKKEFAGKKVFGVTEITEGTDITYHIVLQDDHHWTLVQSSYTGTMSVEKRYKKA